jgi:hypothetical protein
MAGKLLSHCHLVTFFVIILSCSGLVNCQEEGDSLSNELELKEDNDLEKAYYYEDHYPPPSPSRSEESFINKLLRFGLSLLAASLLWFVWDFGVTPNDVIWGVPLHKSITKISWPTEESSNLVVSNTKTVTATFNGFNGQPLDRIMSRGHLTVEIICNQRLVPHPTLAESDDGKELQIIFNARLAGSYAITLRSNHHCVRGFPTTRNVAAGDVDPSSTLLHKLRSHTLVLTSGVPEDIQLDPRDKYGNVVDQDNLTNLTSRITFQLWYINSSDGGRKHEKVSATNFVVYRTSVMDCLCISVAFRPGEEGWYVAQVQLDGQSISTGDLSLIVLSRNERAKVDRFLHNRRSKNSTDADYFEADIVSLNGQGLGKPRKVYCYLTDKQLIIREYFLRIFVKRAFTFRLVPATKMLLVRYKANSPIIRIEDSYQTTGPEICLRDGNILAACFHLLLLEKVGGSESFRDKKVFFNLKLLAYHQIKGHRHVPLNLTIQRFPSIMKSSYNATRWLSESDWAKLFVIEFDGEPGIDQGGLRREWFELVTKELFKPDNGLFVQVEEERCVNVPNFRMEVKLNAREKNLRILKLIFV